MARYYTRRCAPDHPDNDNNGGHHDCEWCCFDIDEPDTECEVCATRVDQGVTLFFVRDDEEVGLVRVLCSDCT